MTEEFIKVIPNRDVAPVNRIVKADKYREDESGGGGGGSFASILEQHLAGKKDKTSKEAKEPEQLKRMEGMNQYDAQANAFFYRLSWSADYKA